MKRYSKEVEEVDAVAAKEKQQPDILYQRTSSGGNERIKFEVGFNGFGG